MADRDHDGRLLRLNSRDSRASVRSSFCARNNIADRSSRDAEVSLGVGDRHHITRPSDFRGFRESWHAPRHAAGVGLQHDPTRDFPQFGPFSWLPNACRPGLVGAKASGAAEPLAGDICSATSQESGLSDAAAAAISIAATAKIRPARVPTGERRRPLSRIACTRPSNPERPAIGSAAAPGWCAPPSRERIARERTHNRPAGRPSPERCRRRPILARSAFFGQRTKPADGTNTGNKRSERRIAKRRRDARRATPREPGRPAESGRPSCANPGGNRTHGLHQPTHKGMGVRFVCRNSIAQFHPNRRQTSETSSCVAGSRISCASSTTHRAARAQRTDCHTSANGRHDQNQQPKCASVDESRRRRMSAPHLPPQSAVGRPRHPAASRWWSPRDSARGPFWEPRTHFLRGAILPKQRFELTRPQQERERIASRCGITAARVGQLGGSLAACGGGEHSAIRVAVRETRRSSPAWPATPPCPAPRPDAASPPKTGGAASWQRLPPSRPE